MIRVTWLSVIWNIRCIDIGTPTSYIDRQSLNFGFDKYARPSIDAEYPFHVDSFHANGNRVNRVCR